jgi:hypothetical protein
VFAEGSVPDVDGEGVADGCGEVVVVPAGLGGVVEPVVVVVVVGVVVGAVELVDDEAPVGSVPVDEGLVPVEVGAVPAGLADGSGVVADCGDESTVSDMLLNELVEESGAAVETPEVSAAGGGEVSAAGDDGSVGADDGSAGADPVAAVEAAAGSSDGGVWSGDDDGCVEAEPVWSGVVGVCPDAADPGADKDGAPVEDADAGVVAGGEVVEAGEDDGGLPKPGGSCPTELSTAVGVGLAVPTNVPFVDVAPLVVGCVDRPWLGGAAARPVRSVTTGAFTGAVAGTGGANRIAG